MVLERNECTFQVALLQQGFRSCKKKPFHRKGFHVPDGFEWSSIHLLDRFAWTNLSAGAAIRAFISVDHVFGIALGNTIHGTFRRAVSASNTFVGNHIDHFQILIKSIKPRLISLSNPHDVQDSVLESSSLRACNRKIGAEQGGSCGGWRKASAMDGNKDTAKRTLQMYLLHFAVRFKTL